jgi:hypothetical protein
VKKQLSVLLAVLVLSASHAVCAPQEADTAPQISGERMTRLELNIAHAIIWHLYWREGKTEAQIHKLAIESRPMPYTVRRGENDDLSVYLAEYQWKIDLTPIGSDYYGFYVEDFKALARNDATEAKRSYLEALNRETEITNGVLTLRPEHLSVLAFDKPGDRRYQLIVNVVMTNLLDSRWLKKDMAASKVHGPLTVHVGGFSGQSPWIYYHVEGMPYVGMMLIDPSSGEFIHDDLQYIGDNPRESEYEVMRRKIDRSNIKLSLHPPTQTTKAESP